MNITSDNEPQFQSKEFEKYLVDNGILHRKVTPPWNRANGEVERQNGSLVKGMSIAQAEVKDWRNELIHYLATHITMPHSVTGVFPAESLFGRRIRTKLPEFGERAVNDETVPEKRRLTRRFMQTQVEALNYAISKRETRCF